MPTMLNIPCYPADKVLFPAFNGADNEGRESTTFYQDFKIAEKFGFDAVKETFTNAMTSWGENCAYLTELACVTNHLCWEHYQKDDKLCRFYADCYHKVDEVVYQCDEDGNNTSPFTDEEVRKYTRVLD